MPFSLTVSQSWNCTSAQYGHNHSVSYLHMFFLAKDMTEKRWTEKKDAVVKLQLHQGSHLAALASFAALPWRLRSANGNPVNRSPDGPMPRPSWQRHGASGANEDSCDGSYSSIVVDLESFYPGRLANSFANSWDSYPLKRNDQAKNVKVFPLLNCRNSYPAGSEYMWNDKMWPLFLFCPITSTETAADIVTKINHLLMSSKIHQNSIGNLAIQIPIQSQKVPFVWSEFMAHRKWER